MPMPFAVKLPILRHRPIRSYIIWSKATKFRTVINLWEGEILGVEHAPSFKVRSFGAPMFLQVRRYRKLRSGQVILRKSIYPISQGMQEIRSWRGCGAVSIEQPGRSADWYVLEFEEVIAKCTRNRRSMTYWYHDDSIEILRETPIKSLDNTVKKEESLKITR